MNASKLFIIVAISAQEETSLSDLIEAFFETYKDIKNGCLKETNLTDEIVHQFTKSAKVLENKDFECFVKCMFVNTKILNSDGSINDVAIRQSSQLVKPSDLDIITGKCGIKKDDICDTAVAVLGCALDVINSHLTS